MSSEETARPRRIGAPVAAGTGGRYRQTVGLIVLLAVLCVVSLLTVLAFASAEQNRQARHSAEEALTAVLADRRADMENAALALARMLHNADVGETGRRMTVIDANSTFGDRLRLSAMFVLSPEGDKVFRKLGALPQAALRAGAETLPADGFATLGFYPGETPGLVHLAAAAVVPGSSGMVRVVLVRAIDRADLAAIGDSFGIASLEFVAGTGGPGLSLEGLDGKSVAGRLIWRAESPGNRTLEWALIPVILVIVVAAAFALVLSRRVGQGEARLRESARRLENANLDLVHSRQRFRDFAESSSDWFWETGADHRYTYISERVALILGDDPKEVFGATLLDLGKLVDDRQDWTDCLADIEAGRAFRDLEVTWVDGAEKTYIFRISGRPVFDETGYFQGYRGSGVDVTVETLALTEARFMQEVVQDSLDSVSEGFVLFSADGRLLFCNEQYRKAYPNLADVLLPGVTFAEIIRIAAERSDEGDDSNNIGTWIQERIERHLGKTTTDDRFLSNGRWYRISEHATASGGIVKVLTDITELKEREQQLAGQIATATESEERYRQLFETAPYGIVIWDGDSVRFSNLSAATILGLEGILELEGTRLADHFEDGAALENDMLKAAEGEIQRLEWSAVRPDGERRAVELRAYPAVFKKEPTVLLFIDDVTDRKRVEEELQRSQKMEAVGRMAGGIAHEFNNMLTAIGGFARLAERAPEDTERVLLSVREIAKASERAAALTGQLLDFSRRRVTEESEVVPLAALVRDLRVFLKPLISTGIEVSIDIRDEDAHAVANPVTLNQAILNLAINARDAMPNGGNLIITLDTWEPPPSFFQRHDATRPGRYAAISVTDTGTGIPEEIRDRIWEPFFTTKELGKGTGLGLSMVYGTAQQAGGAVELASEVGVGTTFTIALPLAAPPDLQAAAIDSLRLEDGESLRVLLVDDERSVRAFMKLALEEAGCEVVEAGNGLEAIERFDEAGGLFDIVVTDVAMPRMNGVEMSAALIERNPYLRMLFLTGYASREQAAALTGHEGWQLLMKPVSPEKLLRAVHELVSA
jgi:two-component system, cell cycle sensor histidine kinase and response regulator CckA